MSGMPSVQDELLEITGAKTLAEAMQQVRHVFGTMRESEVVVAFSPVSVTDDGLAPGVEMRRARALLLGSEKTAEVWNTERRCWWVEEGPGRDAYYRQVEYTMRMDLLRLILESRK